MTPVKPFEELAQEWAPRAKRFLGLVADQFSLRVKQRLPGLITGSAFLFAAVSCVAGIGAWLSIAAWFALQDHGISALNASLILVGSLTFLGIAFFFIGRERASRPSGPPIEILPPDNHEIEEAGQDLITLFKDLTIAARRSLNPVEAIKPHAVKIVLATTAVGFLVALNVTARKEKTR